MNVIELPEPIMLLPREKPLPEPKPTTKWEKFAREKGIKKRKHSRLIWDEVSKSYKPRQIVKNRKPAIMDAPADGSNPYATLNAEKKARIAKNKRQQIKNLQYNQKQRYIKQQQESAPKRQQKR